MAATVSVVSLLFVPQIPFFERIPPPEDSRVPGHWAYLDPLVKRNMFVQSLLSLSKYYYYMFAASNITCIFGHVIVPQFKLGTGEPRDYFVLSVFVHSL